MNLNSDSDELAKFDKLAAHWWDENGDLKTLHQINPLRLAYIQQKSNLKDKKIADIGCGGGILSESLASLGGIVTGIDLNPSLIKVGKLHLHESGLKVEYLLKSVEELAVEREAEFDILTCLELLEHVPDPKSIIKSCAKLLKKGGHIFFSTLNRNPKSYLFSIIGAEYLLKLLPKNTHDYAKFIKPSELANWCSEFGITPKETKGITYQPLSKEFKLSDDISVNYLLYGIKEW